MHVPYFFADKYLCYYCTKATSAENEILHHLDHYHPMEKLSVRARILCEKSGKYLYQSKHFPILCNEMKGFAIDIANGKLKKLHTNTNEGQPLQKQHLSDKDSVEIELPTNDPCYESKEDNTAQGETDWRNVMDIIPEVMDIMKSEGRDEDFCAVLEGIMSGTLTQNIALHFLLDVGQFLRQPSVHSMRYSETSKKFWLAISKLFKGKGIRFFRGRREEEASGMSLLYLKIFGPLT